MRIALSTDETHAWALVRSIVMWAVKTWLRDAGRYEDVMRYDIACHMNAKDITDAYEKEAMSYGVFSMTANDTVGCDDVLDLIFEGE